MTDDKKDYEIGYRRPPKKHQFKPGQSGNPSGRPKRKQSYFEILEEEFSRVIPAIEDGRESRVSTFRGKLRQALQRGDYPMLRYLLQVAQLVGKNNPNVEEPPNYTEALRAKIEAVARKYEERKKSEDS